MFKRNVNWENDISLGGASESERLWQVADEFRAWVVRDLQALPLQERAAFRGDYLFVIDHKPCCLVVVTPELVSSGRIEFPNGRAQVAFDMGAPSELTSETIEGLFNDGAVRVKVTTDSNTLRRLLGGTLKAKIAYINGLVKIAGDLPCFMRLVSVLKGRGVGPLKVLGPDASESPAPRSSR